MIKIKTTPNLYGISLIGDYQDLKELWQSIGDYLRFYIENNDAYPYHEYEFLLSLNYDIRHAYMGCRGVSIEENNAEEVGMIAQGIYEIPEEAKEEFNSIQRKFKNGNLYYQVEILYPQVFHYMIALGLILDDYYLNEWLGIDSSVFPSYDILSLEHDRAVVQHFVSLLWINVRELFGTETAIALYDYYENCEPFFLSYIYTDALIHCQIANWKEMNTEQKKKYLLLSIYELMDTVMMLEEPEEYDENYELYKNAFQLSNTEKNGRKIFPMKEEFFASLENYFPANKPLYEDDFDQFLIDTYGEAPDDEPDW